MLKNLKKRLKNQRGLTLIELLAVIVILGIIAAIAIPSIGSIIAKSKYDAAKADALQVLNAAKIYAANNEVTAGATGAISNGGALDSYIKDVEYLASYTITFDANGVPSINAPAKAAVKDSAGATPTFTGTVPQVRDNFKYKP